MLQVTLGFHHDIRFRNARRNAPHRSAPQFRPHLRNCGEIQHGSNSMPQALALSTFFRDVFVEWDTLVVRCVAFRNPYVTTSSAVAMRPLDASCLSVVSFNSTKH